MPIRSTDNPNAPDTPVVSSNWSEGTTAMELNDSEWVWTIRLVQPGARYQHRHAECVGDTGKAAEVSIGWVVYNVTRITRSVWAVEKR